MNKEQLQQDYQNGRRDFSNLDLSGLDLTEINLEGGNLTGTDLSGACLNGANLANTNLTRANLSKTRLARSNLVGATLNSANLSKTRLYCTNFTNANLTNANLTNIEFENTNFENTNFKGANLQGIQFEGTSFFYANLIDAKNIPSPIFSPSFIPKNHLDIDLVNSIRSVTEGLLCFSESEYPYDIFLWDVETRGRFTLEKFLKEMGYLKSTNIQNLQSVNSETEQLTIYCQILLDKIQGQLSDIEIYQFETRYMRSCNSTKPYIVIQEYMYEGYEEDEIDEEDIIDKEKREVLTQLVLNNLSNIRLYLIGECDMEIYLIGESLNQYWLGIHTGVVWT